MLRTGALSEEPLSVTMTETLKDMNDFNDSNNVNAAKIITLAAADRRMDTRGAAGSAVPPESPEMLNLLEQARQFLFSAHMAALGTLDGGVPYVSAVNIVAANDGTVLMQVSALAEHSRNLEVNGACSLLISSSDASDSQSSPRLSLVGHAEKVSPEQAERYLRLFPHTQDYLQLDFYFLAVHIDKARWIPSFANAAWLSGEQLTAPVPWDTATELSMVEHMNHDHARAIARYAQLMAESEPTNLAAIDPWGMWLLADGRRLRFPFEVPVHSVVQARQTLVELAQV